MPLILSLMDDVSKGQPISSTYLELWCRTFDESFVTLSKPREMAFHAGFDGRRAERTWRSRLDITHTDDETTDEGMTRRIEPDHLIPPGRRR